MTAEAIGYGDAISIDFLRGVGFSTAIFAQPAESI